MLADGIVVVRVSMLIVDVDVDTLSAVMTTPLEFTVAAP